MTVPWCLTLRGICADVIACFTELLDGLGREGQDGTLGQYRGVDRDMKLWGSQSRSRSDYQHRS